LERADFVFLCNKDHFWVLRSEEMSNYFSNITGPFSVYPLPTNVIVSNGPTVDGGVDIGQPTKRYRTANMMDVHTQTLEADVSISLSGVDLQTTLDSKMGNNAGGDLDMKGYSVLHVNNISGNTYTRNADYLVSNTAATSTTGHFASFADNTGLVIQDAGAPPGNLVFNTGTSTTSHLASFSNGTGKDITDSGLLSTQVVKNQDGSATSGHIASFADGTGTVIHDGGAVSGDIVQRTNPVSTPGHLVNFTNGSATGVADSGITYSNVLLADGTVSMAATLHMGSHQIDGITFLNTVNATALVTNGGSSTTGNLANFSDNSGKNVADTGIASTNVFLADGTVPMTANLNMNQFAIQNVRGIDGINRAKQVATSSTTPAPITAAMTFPANSTHDGTIITVRGTMDVSLKPAESFTLTFNSTPGGDFAGPITLTNATGANANGRLDFQADLYVMGGGFIRSHCSLSGNSWWDASAPPITWFDSENGVAWDPTLSNVLVLNGSVSIGGGGWPSIVGFDYYYVQQFWS
jgi:hypothetical protein